jgi:hypothetical protein
MIFIRAPLANPSSDTQRSKNRHGVIDSDRDTSEICTTIAFDSDFAMVRLHLGSRWLWIRRQKLKKEGRTSAS